MNKPVKEEYINQHWAPESYLVRFTNDQGTFYVFDKVTGKVRADKPRNVAAAKHFYTYPEDAFPEEIRGQVDRKVIEFTFRDEIEPGFQAAISEALKCAEGGTLPRNLREPLVYFVIMQLLRTRSYREAIKQLMQKRAETDVRRKAEELFLDVDPRLYPTVEVPDHNVILTHNALLFTDEFIRMHMEVLMNYIWMIAAIPESAVFYTSDTPVARTVVDPTGELFGANLWGEGVEYSLPLDPKRVLLLLERTYFGTRFTETLINEGTVIVANDQIIRRLNQAQVANSYRCVFSLLDEFSTARTLCRKRPEICKLDRARIKPVDTDDRLSNLN